MFIYNIVAKKTLPFHAYMSNLIFYATHFPEKYISLQWSHHLSIFSVLTTLLN